MSALKFSELVGLLFAFSNSHISSTFI